MPRSKCVRHTSHAQLAPPNQEEPPHTPTHNIHIAGTSSGATARLRCSWTLWGTCKCRSTQRSRHQLRRGGTGQQQLQQLQQVVLKAQPLPTTRNGQQARGQQSRQRQQQHLLAGGALHQQQQQQRQQQHLLHQQQQQRQQQHLLHHHQLLQQQQQDRRRAVGWRLQQSRRDNVRCLLWERPRLPTPSCAMEATRSAFSSQRLRTPRFVPLNSKGAGTLAHFNTQRTPCT